MQRRYTISYSFLILLCATLVLPANGGSTDRLQSGRTIYIGAEARNDWPPFEFFQREDGKPTEKIVGYTIDVLNEIFSKHRIEYDFRAYPWARCLSNLVSGEKIQMVLPASLDEERRSKYLISDTVYTITPSFFYLKKNYPNGLKIKSPEDFLTYSEICGRHGYNYVNFGLENEKVKRYSKNFKSLISMLKKNRCHIVLARYEVMAGHGLLGTSYLNDEIGYAPVPGVPPESFHFMISKNYPHGDALLKIINSGILRLRKQGRLKKILKKYIP
ncbi:MAG: transporter substrate-binding domain-containing protein [Desulfobacterium sp.]|nr:transporter substrate-binding domain-containing protein [Desulfobacterium sp.]